MNTLSDTLCTRRDLGFTLPSSTTAINHLLYADDVCLISNLPAGCQHLLDVVQRWLEWSCLKAKVPKCHEMSLQASTGKTVNPNLTLGGEAIPEFDGSWGMSVWLHINNSTAKTTLVDDLKRMLEAVDKAPVTRQQKLRLYKQGICPRVSWPLLVEEFPVTWLERHLQPLTTRFLKRWTGLACCSNTAILFLPGWPFLL